MELTIPKLRKGGFFAVPLSAPEPSTLCDRAPFGGNEDSSQACTVESATPLDRTMPEPRSGN